jgi:exopolysaccharide biosynthesis polyprenyl glycosylphosphotransferase
VYQFASVVRWGRNTGARNAIPAQAGPQDTTSKTALQLAESPVRPLAVPAAVARRAPVRAGEIVTLLTLDLVAVAAVAYAAGSSWPATAIRAVAITIALAVAGLHRSRLQFAVLDDIPRILLAVVGVVALVGWLAPPSEGIAVVWAAATFAAVVAGRIAGYRLLRRHRLRAPGRATILVGCGDVAVRLAEALRDDRSYGLVPVGFVGPRPLTSPPLPVLASAAGLEKAIRKYKPLHLIVTFATLPDADLIAMLRRARRGGVTVHVVPRLFELAAGHGRTELIRGIPLVRLRPEPAQMRRWAVKRLIDVVGALIGLVLLAPVLLACAIAVLCESGRHGVLFRQERISRDGKPFTILKFRSLTPASDTESQVKWNINTDARLGIVGKLLRFSSLDELPQLVNVLRGDMSLVGPRPERPYFVEQFERTYAGYPDRHRVPAGITGWAQIHGLRGDTSIEERVRFDNHYIEHWTLGMDIKIIMRTVGAMLSIHRV